MQFAEVFKVAAKAGALEGYLYERERVEPLGNWVENIDRMYRGLPGVVKEEINKEFADVLMKIMRYGNKTLEADLQMTLTTLLAELQE